MDKLIRWTILGTIAGAILAFNMYHADYKLLVAQVGAIVVVTMLIIAGIRLKAVNIKNPVIWFIGVCALSFILSQHKFTSGQELYKVVAWITFGMAVGIVSCQLSAVSYQLLAFSYQLKGGKLVEDIVNVWLLCTAIVCVYGILQFFGIDFMRFRLQHNRVVSTFGNPTLLAGFLAMTLPVALAKAHEIRGRTMGSQLSAVSGQLSAVSGQRQETGNRQQGTGGMKLSAFSGQLSAISCQLSAISLVVVLITCLILTRSRAGMIAAMAGAGVFYILRAKSISSQFGRPSKALKLVMTILACVITVVGILLILPQTRPVILDSLLRKTARFDIWRDTLRMAQFHPALGTGIGTFSAYFPNFANQNIYAIHYLGVEFINHAHSEYLEILSEMGVLGLGAFLSVIGYVIYRAVKNREDSGLYSKGLLAAFIAILVNNLVGVDLRYTSTGLFFWMIGGVLGSGGKDGLSAVSFQPSAISYQLSAVSGRRKIANVMIIIASVTAVYFTVKPYALIKAPKEQSFFIDSTEQVDKKIKNLETREEKGADYLFNMGILYAKKKEYKAATGYFFKTLELNPAHSGAYNNLGNLEMVAGNMEKAKQCFEKAVEIEPKNIDYLLNLSSACFTLNRLEEAVGAVERVLKIDPNNSRAILLRRQMTQ